jgi:photosystem II stability/assembly factor-like uncharacterized protein
MKRNQKPALAAVTLFAAAFSRLAAQELWTPDVSGSVYDLATGPAGTLYAGIGDGVARSTEFGVWTQLANSPVGTNVIAADPSDPNTVYTGSTAYAQWGLYKSSDGGGLFQKLPGYPAGVTCIAIDPAEPKTVYVGGVLSQVYKTTDGGASWTTPVSAELVNQISALLIDPTRPGTIYAGSDQGDFDYHAIDYYLPPTAPVIRSTDSGAHWSPALEQAVDAASPVYTQALAVDPRTGALYAAARDDFGGGLVLRSVDAGSTWPQRVSLGSVGDVTALLVDPIRAKTLYAGTHNAGVLRSIDEGLTWSPMNDGLENTWVSSLAFDAADGMMRAVVPGVAVYAIRIAPPFTCTPGSNQLCLLGGRYAVSVTAEDSATGAAAAGAAIPGADRFGSFSLPAFTGDRALPEVFVKMIDPSQGTGVWFFYGGLTSLPYTITAFDTLTGRVETYKNRDENRYCGGADGSAFFGDTPGPWDYVHSTGTAKGARSATAALPLFSGRFSVTLSAHSSLTGRTAQGVAVAKTDRYGYFSLPAFTGDPSFPEVYVKLVDLTAITGSFGFFYSGLTSLDYTLTVADSVTGEVRTFDGAGDFCGAVQSLASGDAR